MTDEPDRAREFIEAAGQVAGQVIAATAGLTLDPVAAAMATAGAGTALGEAFSRIGAELCDRLLPSRQRGRVVAALGAAGKRYEVRLAEGDELRSDGFFDDGDHGSTVADEVLEGTLLTAANAYEERKVPLLGNLYANTAFEEGVSAAYANYLLRLAERLTFRQLALLGFFRLANESPDRFPLAEIAVEHEEAGTDASVSIIAEMNDLSGLRLLMFQGPDGLVAPTDTWGTSSWAGKRVYSAALSEVGEEVVRLMGLDRLSEQEWESILSELREGSMGG